MYRTIRSCTKTYRAIQIRASDVSHDTLTYKKLTHDTGNSIKLLSYVSHDTFMYKNLSHDTGEPAEFVSREVGIMNVR